MSDDCLLTSAFLTHIQGCQKCRNLLVEILQQTGYPLEAAMGIPNLDLAEIDACPWQTYQKKPAKAGQVAWIKNPAYWERFDAPPVLWELVKALESAKDRKLVLGDMEYVFGGKDDMKDRFINRKPVKTESAT